MSLAPTFTMQYHRFEAPPVDYDALYKKAFAQIGERTTITLSAGRVSCQSGMHNTRWNNNLPRIKHNPNNAATIFDAERFADALGSELRIHEEIARAKEPRFVERTLSDNFALLPHHHVFAPIEQMKADIREAGGWIAYWEKQNPIAQHLSWEAKFHEEFQRYQSHAYNDLLQSALGFEPTEHSDAPPYIPTTPTTSNPQPCIDFGFEPTEASE